MSRRMPKCGMRGNQAKTLILSIDKEEKPYIMKYSAYYLPRFYVEIGAVHSVQVVEKISKKRIRALAMGCFPTPVSLATAMDEVHM